MLSVSVVIWTPYDVLYPIPPLTLLCFNIWSGKIMFLKITKTVQIFYGMFFYSTKGLRNIPVSLSYSMIKFIWLVFFFYIIISMNWYKTCRWILWLYKRMLRYLFYSWGRFKINLVPNATLLDLSVIISNITHLPLILSTRERRMRWSRFKDSSISWNWWT